MWLAKLAEKGLLRPSFVPPAPIRRAARLHPAAGRSDPRARPLLAADGEAARRRADQVVVGGLRHHRSRLGRAMLEALIAGEQRPAPARRPGPAQDATQAGSADRGVDRPLRRASRRACPDTARSNRRVGHQDRHPHRSHRRTAGHPHRPAARIRPRTRRATRNLRSPDWLRRQRLAEITGIGPVSAQVVIAEIGLDMTRFPTAAHLVSWAKLSPRTIQSGATHRGGKTGKGNPYLKGVLGEAAAVAARTDTSSENATGASSNVAAS